MSSAGESAIVHAALPYGQLLESAFDATTVGMVIVDGDGCIVVVNEPATRMFGYAREELIGREVEALVPARLRGGHGGFRRGFQRAPNARSMGVGRDLRALRKDGSEFPVEIGLQP